MGQRSLKQIEISAIRKLWSLSCTIFEFFDVEQHRDLEIGVGGHSMPLKLVLFESLGAVSYSPSIVTMAIYCIVCEI